MSRVLFAGLMVIGLFASNPAGAQDAPPMPLSEALARAQELLDAGDVENARRMITRALERDTGNPDVLLLDARIAEAERDIDRAEKRYLAVVRLVPNNFEANFGLGKIYERAKVPRQAIPYFERARDHSTTATPKQRSELFQRLSNAYRRDGKKPEALNAARFAIESDPDNFDAWRQLVEQQVWLKDWVNAVENAQRLVARAMDYVARERGTAAAYTELYRAYDTMIGAMRLYFQTLFLVNPDGSRSERVTPGNERVAAQILSQLADLRIMQIEVRDKLEFFELSELTARGLTYQPDYVPLLLQHGLLLRNTGRFSEAQDVFVRILSIDPDQADARAELELLGQLAAAAAPPPVGEDVTPTTSPVEDIPEILLGPLPGEEIEPLPDQEPPSEEPQSETPPAATP